MTMMEWAQETRARDTNSNTTHSYTDTHTDSLHDRPTHTREKGGWPPSEREDERERRRNKEREATTTRRVVRPSCVTSASVRQWWAWLEQETKRPSHNDGLNCPGYAIFFRTPSEYGEDLRFVDRSDRLDSLLERSSSRSSVVVAKEWSSGGQRSLVSILLGWWWLEARSLCIRWHGWCSIYRTCCWIASSYCNLQSYRIAADVRVSPIQSNPIQSNPIQSSYSFQSIWVEISITRARVGLVLDAASRSRAAAAAAHVAVVSAAGVRRLPYLTRSSFVVRRS